MNVARAASARRARRRRSLPRGPRSGPQEFGDRFDFARHGADALGLTVGVPGQAPLVQAMLPWPA